MRPGPPKKTRSDLICYCGINAVKAVFAARPDDIERFSLTKSAGPSVQELLSWCRSRSKPVQFVSAEELEKISKSTHNEGVALLAKRKPVTIFDPKRLRRVNGRCLVVALDGVSNPHNFGTILRNAAHFGVAMVLGRAGEMPGLSAAACRVAEGGAEVVEVCETEDLAAALKMLTTERFEVIATSNRAASSLYELSFPKLAVLILGAEGQGVSKEIERTAARRVVIPGSGAVESLNVASASAVLLGEWHRQSTLKSGAR